jgi:cyclohexyl-isocyanide hydratase
MSHDAHQRDMAALKPLRFGLLLFPRLTALDLVGPQLLMATMMRTEVHLLSKTRAPVMTDSGFEIVPTTTYADCPSDLDVFFVPGGPKGTAGLLKGYKASSHWGTRDMLPIFGAEPVEARVVTDRNRITGGGITAGLDFGLVLAAELRGEATARLQELVLEYDPRPPFNSGTLRTARPETVQLARTVLATDLDSVRDAANQAKARRSV